MKRATLLARISHPLPAAAADLLASTTFLAAAPPATCFEHDSTAPWSKRRADKPLRSLTTQVCEKCGLVLLLLAAACASNRPQPRSAATAEPATAAIPDTMIGLNHHSIFDAPEPAPVVPVSADPGEAKTRHGAFPGAPPVIPHSTDGLLPITRAENACLGCHDRANAADAEAPPAPADHYLDLRNARTVKRTEIAGARFSCTACHVPQTQARPLVANTFEP